MGPLISLLEDVDEEVDEEVVVADDVFVVAVAITAVVVVGTAMLEIAEAADRLASPSIDQTLIDVEAAVWFLFQACDKNHPELGSRLVVNI